MDPIIRAYLALCWAPVRCSATLTFSRTALKAKALSRERSTLSIHKTYRFPNHQNADSRLLPRGHLSALAYMTDSYFVGTIARVHNLRRFGGASSDINLRPSAPFPSPSLSSSSSSHSKTPASNKRTSRSSNDYLARLAAREAADNHGSQASDKPQERVGMMVSLDHTYAILPSVPPFA